MKARNVTLILVTVLMSLSTQLHAQYGSTPPRPCMGVLLDRTPLPDLLVKHFNLSPDQGIRIMNVHRDSPADKAGLQRDDIIIAFQDKDVTDLEEFVEAVRDAGVGAEVSLEIIHEGRPKTVNLKLEKLKADFDWKYPPEPQIERHWRPGKFWRLKPGDKHWMQVPFDRIPGDINIDLFNLFSENYSYRYSEDDESYTVTIEGDPDDDDTKISIRVTKPEYETTVKEIDDLPRKYRANAKEALKNARKSARQRERIKELWPWSPSPDDDGIWQRFFDRPSPHQPAPSPLPDDRMFDRLERQMRDLQRRLDEMEKRQKQMLDPLPDELEKPAPPPPDKDADRQNSKNI